jgi:hypothetical protein
MDALQVTARLAIHEGKLEEFKELAAQCMQLVRERDSGTLQYDWFFNDDHTECVLRETYKDSGALWSTLPIWARPSGRSLVSAIVLTRSTALHPPSF